MELFFTSILVIVLLVDVSLIFFWIFNYKDETGGITETPFVSILIAARNEENNIGDCLEAIMALDYPRDQFEVLVGNDMSDDQTDELLEAYSARYSQLRSYTIYKKLVKGNGKANVLAQLARMAKGDYLFITDADIKVPENWLQSMLLGMNEETALVTGTSVVVGNGFLAYMQQLDWLFATGMLKVVSDMNIPVTTMGNNMLIRRQIYEEVGGYEAMPFSVTEDLELFNHIKDRYKTTNLYNPGVLNESKPQNSLLDLLTQRKRWLRGAFGLPKIMIGILLIQASYMAIVLGITIAYPLLGLVALLTKLILRFVFVSLVVKKLEGRVNIFGSIIFEFYSAFFSLVSLLFYLLSGEIEWKGRKY